VKRAWTAHRSGSGRDAAPADRHADRARLRAFAAAHRLRLRREGLGEALIPGRFGCIYDPGDGRRLGMMILGAKASIRRWNSRRRSCLAAGMELHMDGDAEGALLFVPDDRNQVEAAMKAIGAYRRRQLSTDHRDRLVRAGAPFRFDSPTVLRAPSRAQKGRGPKGEGW
jgi:hypothetical protein